jgi:serine/threonine protein kinase
LFLEIGGKDLFEFFDANPLGVDEHIAKQVMMGISTAVDYLHNEAHICHRDLKPENILLMEGSDTSNVKHYHVRVCDFGHSTRYEKGKEFFDLCGSPGFFAPEMILSSGPRYDGLAADIWSIGCIMLELIRGHDEFCTCWMSAYDYDILQDESAFEHSLKSALDIIQNQRQETIICNDSSTFMEEFLVKLLELEPTNRLTASEIVKHPWFQFRDVRSAKMCHCPSGSETKASKIPAHERDRLCNSFSLEATKHGCDSYEEKSTAIELKHHRVRSKPVSFPLKDTEDSLSSNIPDTPSIKAVQKSVLECEKLVRSIQYNADD